jgi:hypothetical protein
MTLEARKAMHARYFLKQRGRIVRAGSGSKSAYGGREHRLQTVADNVPCKATAPNRTQSVESGVRSIALGDWDVLLPIGTSVSISDEVHIGSDTYEVIGSDAGRAEALCLTVYCRRKSSK